MFGSWSHGISPIQVCNLLIEESYTIKREIYIFGLPEAATHRVSFLVMFILKLCHSLAYSQKNSAVRTFFYTVIIIILYEITWLCLSMFTILHHI